MPSKKTKKVSGWDRMVAADKAITKARLREAKKIDRLLMETWTGKKTKKVRVFIFDKPKKPRFSIDAIGYIDGRDRLWMQSGKTSVCLDDVLLQHIKPYEKVRVAIKISQV